MVHLSFSFVLQLCIASAGAFLPPFSRSSSTTYREQDWTSQRDRTHERHVLERQSTSRPVSSAGRAGDGVLPLHEQPYKLVSVWLCEGEEMDVPWRALGDLLFEFGAVSVSINCREGEEQQQGQGLSLIVPGGADTKTMLEHACGLVDPAGPYIGSLDWEEDPVACLESWEALTVGTGEEGFPTIECTKLQVVPVQRCLEPPPGVHQIRVLEGQGWGNGEHPTTKMCLDFLEHTIQGGEEEVVDYGCGSGVLTAGALLLGVKHVTAVDIDLEVLEHTEENLRLNGVRDRARVVHTRHITLGELQGEIIVANILVGPLRRLMPVLVLAVKEGGQLCLSGFRRSDMGVLKSEYGKYIDWDDSLEDSRTHPIWGEWMRIVGRPKPGMSGRLKIEMVNDLSEAATL
ncbi:unnamed protein product [Discosporangium mesarthrocarpum]